MNSFSKEELLDFNIISGLKELGDDDSFFREIIDLYVEQYPDLLEKIKLSYSEGDLINISKSAHALKGASLNIGAKKLAEICLKIETISSFENTSSIEELISDLQDIYEISIEELRKL